MALVFLPPTYSGSGIRAKSFIICYLSSIDMNFSAFLISWPYIQCRFFNSNRIGTSRRILISGVPTWTPRGTFHQEGASFFAEMSQEIILLEALARSKAVRRRGPHSSKGNHHIPPAIAAKRFPAINSSQKKGKIDRNASRSVPGRYKSSSLVSDF